MMWLTSRHIGSKQVESLNEYRDINPDHS